MSTSLGKLPGLRRTGTARRRLRRRKAGKMARNGHPRSQTRVVQKAFSSRSVAFSSPIPYLRTLRTPKRARVWLDLSLPELGAEVARLTGRPRPYAKSTVSLWEKTGQVEPDVRRAYGTLI